MEREKGFESVVSHGVSCTYATLEKAPEGSTRPPEGSVRVHTETFGGDTSNDVDGLPIVTPELFIVAGMTLAQRATQFGAAPLTVQGILGRAVQQAVAVRPRPR
jgi:hypothetical protein